MDIQQSQVERSRTEPVPHEPENVYAAGGPDEIRLFWPNQRLSVTTANPQTRLLEASRLQMGSSSGQLLFGDNFDSLSWLLQNGHEQTVRLIYCDPPYNSNRAYRRRVRLRGKGQPVLAEQIAYHDVWQTEVYLQFLADRLLLLRELLHPDGTLWLHCDHRMQAHLLLLLSEVFGPGCHLNTIFWRSQTMRGAKVHARYFPNSAQSIHIFRRSADGNPTWHPPRRERILTESEAAAQYMRDEQGFFRTSDPGTYRFERLVSLHKEGRLYAPYGGEIVVDEARQRVYPSNGGNLGIKYYLTKRGRNRFVVTKAVDNLWDDIPGIGTVPGEDENYPTQKTERLLQRVIEVATNPEDLVLDGFAGSGTTLAVAQKLGRRWIGCDSNWGAIRTTANRVSRLATNGETAASGGYTVRACGQASVRDVKMDTSISFRIEGVSGRPVLEITAFRDPALQRLVDDAGEDRSSDWRAQVQAVLVDPDYDGETFRPILVDAPAGKNELVAGRYPLSGFGTARQGGTCAVLIVDVAGQEHLALA